MPTTVDCVEKCAGCPVRELFPKTVFVPPLLIEGSTRLGIAECPGSTEVEQSTPLVGASGSWLRGRVDEDGKRSGGLYRAAGIDQSTVSLANVMNCGIAAQNHNIYPTDPEARQYMSKADAEKAQEHCLKNHVEPILADKRWTRLDLLGNKSLQALTGLSPITRWRGSPIAVPQTGKEAPIAIATLHPAALAREQSMMPAVVRDLQKTLDVPPQHYNTQPSLEDVKAFTATEFVTDIECKRDTGEITMVGLCAQKYHAMVVPPTGVYLAELKRIFKDAKTVIGHNILQFDQPRLAAIGIITDAEIFDTMLAQHLLQPDLPHSLEFLGSYFTNVRAWKHTSTQDEAFYCATDCDVTMQCFLQLRPMLRAEKLDKLFSDVQVPLARICHLLHETGFKIDPARLKTVRADLEHRSQLLEEELPAELKIQEVPIRKRVLAPPGTLSLKTGKPLKYVMTDSTETVSPWKSNEVLKQYLYETCKLPVQTHAKTNEPTTDKTAIPKLIRAANQAAYIKENGLERSKGIAKSLRALQDLRQIASLLSTFLQDKWENTGVERIHTSFSVHGTASGRLSSSSPNMQNWPESSRYICVPSYKDWQIMNCDFSSLENRLTAVLASDHERLERLAQPNFNEHKWTCSQFFGIPMEEVVKDNSKDAPYGRSKRIGHGPVTPEHEVLTPNGWVRIDQFVPGTPVAQWSIDGRIEFIPAGLVENDFDGDLVVLEGRGFSGRMTPDHGLPVRSVDRIYDKVYMTRRNAIDLPNFGNTPICGELAGSEFIDENRLRLMVALQADGTVHKKGHVVFHFHKTRKVERLKSLAAGRKYTFTEPHEGDFVFYFPRAEMADVTALLLPGKTFDFGWLCALRPELRRVFLDELPHWDGMRSDDEEGRQTLYLSCNLKNVEIAQTIAHISDRQALLRKLKLTGWRKQEMWSVSFNSRKYASLESLKRSRQPYKGKVYCIQNSQTGFVLFRHNHKITIQSNSNYGMGPMKISRLYDIPFGEVKALCDKWKQVNAKTVEWQTATAAKAKADGYLETPFHRRRWFYTDSAWTESLSFLPQSCGADILFRCMIALMFQRINWPESEVQKIVQVYHPLPNPARMLLTVHDSIVIEAPISMEAEIREILNKVLTQGWPELGGYSIPIETSVGPSWGECH